MWRCGRESIGLRLASLRSVCYVLATWTAVLGWSISRLLPVCRRRTTLCRTHTCNSQTASSKARSSDLRSLNSSQPPGRGRERWPFFPRGGRATVVKLFNAPGEIDQCGRADGMVGMEKAMPANQERRHDPINASGIDARPRHLFMSMPQEPRPAADQGSWLQMGREIPTSHCWR